MTNRTYELLDLNDDCLWEIFKYLSIRDAFNILTIENSRLCEAARCRIAMLKHLYIDIRQDMYYRKKELEIIGGNLKSLHFSIGYSINACEVLDILGPLCTGASAAAAAAAAATADLDQDINNRNENLVQPTLEEIGLHYIQFNPQYFKCLQPILPYLLHLDLSFCQLTDDLLEAVLMQCHQRLRSLKLLANYSLHGDSLRCIRNDAALQSLHVEIHEDWSMDMEKFSNTHPSLHIIVYIKGRTTCIEYGNVRQIK